MTDSDKHCSLLRYGIMYDRKSFMLQASAVWVYYAESLLATIVPFTFPLPTSLNAGLSMKSLS